MKDKRDECGCHRECTTLDHPCGCLTPEEEAELIDKLKELGL